ncbi:MAG TPA: S8 family serine peptidase [Gaiellaceae bacterium]|nr:S8 family serine peptidase [Gaiellaceae bacterium]
MSRLAPLAVAILAAVLAVGGPTMPAGNDARQEVVVLLESPPLARSPEAGARIEREQRSFQQALAVSLPAADLGWRYRLVANGFSLSLPSSEIDRLRTLPGVRDVLTAGSYEPQLASSPQQIGAPALWGPTLDTAGQGVKIGIIDSGIDPEHPFFDPAGYTMPAGFPKGQRRFTTAKVIVARVFAPRSASAPSARLAYSDDDSSHGTHVAGIAAGNPETPTGEGRISGVAPRAYLGNYKVFVETDSGLSPNANSPAIVAAIEAAVADGMDVINFSGGEPEIEPTRDIVALALDAAAAAGVVPVVAAGNDYNDVGAGSVSSPANSEGAIAVGAVEFGGSPATRTHADFSSVGPTTVSLRLKPDVAAPGVDVLSSVSGGDWAEFSGTSMAAPHVAGAAALLRQRHPAWTADQVKSALVQSGTDSVESRDRPAGPRFQGGGVVALPRADDPLLFAEPTALSFGLLAPGANARKTVALEDAGGGVGTWLVSSVVRSGTRRLRLVLPATVQVPGTLTIDAVATRSATSADLDAYVELRRGADVRRIPIWVRVTTERLARHKVSNLGKPGIYRSTTIGRPSAVSRYRYPETPSGIGITTVLGGPERVFRFRIAGRVANAGAVIVERGSSSRVEPRLVAGLDENRLTGYAGLPVNHNPYMDEFREPVLAAAVLAPARGDYAVVFDSGARSGAGRFTFRFWVNDVTPPTLRLRTRSVQRDEPVRIAVSDSGSGVYRDSIRVSVDGSPTRWALGRGVLTIPSGGLSAGTHRIRVRVSDIQESKNTENVARILPNTRTATFTVRVR